MSVFGESEATASDAVAHSLGAGDAATGSAEAVVDAPGASQAEHAGGVRAPEAHFTFSEMSAEKAFPFWHSKDQQQFWLKWGMGAETSVYVCMPSAMPN